MVKLRVQNPNDEPIEMCIRDSNYTVDHSGNLVIIGPDGEQHGFIRAPLNNAKLEAQLPGVLKPQA